MSKYLLFNIGCLECGVSSGIVGLFTERAAAEAAQKVCDNKHDWRQGGQNQYEIFELPVPNVVAEEYR